MSERDELDRWLTEAMQARAEVHVPVDLAALALERVRVAEERKAHLARLGRWLRLTCAAAVLVVGVVLVAGYWSMSASGSGETGDTTSVSTSGSDSSSDGAVLGLAILGVAVVGMVGRVAVLPERQEMGPAT